MNFKPDAARRPSAARLQFTSLIDVIFLLLIYFMTTLSFAKAEADLSSGLLTEKGGGRAADLQPQIIDVGLFQDRPGYRIGQRLVRDKASLAPVLAALPKEGGVFIRVRPEVDVAFVAAAMQACRDAGFERVSYVPAE